MFHELGHAIHSLVERTKYATGQSRDFGEIPSKMLEHFIWLPEVMIRLSRHYKTLPAFTQGGKPRDEKDVVGSVSLPLNLACAVERTKTVNFASGLLNSLRGALFDLALYTPKTHEEATAIDTTALWNRLGHQYLPLKLPDDEETFGQASFSPCFRGNEVGFFTYLM
jgi:metallopeptidase MepB